MWGFVQSKSKSEFESSTSVLAPLRVAIMDFMRRAVAAVPFCFSTRDRS